MNTIRWGMIGCGSVTEVKSGPALYKAHHSTLAAVAARDPARARDFAARHHIATVYDTPEELAAAPGIDIVYIATPPSTHKPFAKLAARAGKHVCVEKPMALRFTECDEIINICERHGVRLYVAFYRRAMPRFLKLKEWLDSGAIGVVRTVRVVQHQPPAPEDLSRDTLPWRLKPEIAGGGKFLDMGVHVLDILDFLFGPMTTVHGIADNAGGLYDVEDTVSAVWRHANGVQGSGSWCYVCGQGQDRVEIAGSEGRIEFEFFTDGPLVLNNAADRQEATILNPPHVHQPFFQSIVDELNGAGTCPGDVQSAARASWAADEILRDYRVRKGY